MRYLSFQIATAKGLFFFVNYDGCWQFDFLRIGIFRRHKSNSKLQHLRWFFCKYRFQDLISGWLHRWCYGYVYPPNSKTRRRKLSSQDSFGQQTENPGDKSLHWVLKWQWFTTLQGTNVSHQNSLLKMIFLFPRWDMLIPWRAVYLYGAETKTIQVKVNFFGEMISPVRPKAWRRFSEGILRRSAWFQTNIFFEKCINHCNQKPLKPKLKKQTEKISLGLRRSQTKILPISLPPFQNISGGGRMIPFISFAFPKGFLQNPLTFAAGLNSDNRYASCCPEMDTFR